MKEHPIIFNTEMVKAILEGRKTQMRRLLDPQPIGLPEGTYCDPYNKNHDHFTFWTKDNKMCLPKGNVKIKGKETAHWKCKYGQIGDKLWVREKFQISKGDFAPTLVEELTKKPIILYYASDNPRYRDQDKWKPSIHMPRWASRIKLEITDVRVERLQEITEHNSKREGCKSETLFSARTKFTIPWNSIHKKEHRWEDNPWVWVISFRKI